MSTRIGIGTQICSNIKSRWQEYKALSVYGKLRWWRDFLIIHSIYIAIAILYIFVQYYSKKYGSGASFLSPELIIMLTRRVSGSLFLALGMGCIMILRGIDLSANRIIGLAAVISASLLQGPDAPYKLFNGMANPPILLVFFLVIGVCGAVSAFNGLCVTKLKIPPFMATCATGLILTGVASWYVTIGNSSADELSVQRLSELIMPYREAVNGYIEIGTTTIPYYVFYAIIAAIIVWFIWNKTMLGKNMYAVGANPEAANVSGISVTKTTISVFIIAGLLYGFSGFVYAARIGSVGLADGAGYALDAFTACLVGGVSLSGGKGKISGIIIAVFILEPLTIAMTWLGSSSGIFLITKGALVLAASAIDVYKHRSMMATGLNRIGESKA